MVLFGIGLLETDWWASGNHFFRDRGRFVKPIAATNTLSAGNHDTLVKVHPEGGANGWDFAFSGAPGTVEGDATSPVTLTNDNNAIRFQPAAPTLQSAVSVSLTPAGSAVQKFRQEFIDIIAPFKSGLRVMDLCGTGADFTTALDPPSAGSCSALRRECPNASDTAADGATQIFNWANGAAMSPDVLAELAEASPEIWVCMPPFLNATEQAAFLAPFQAEPRFRRIWVEYSNEVWNDFVTIARYALDQAIRQNLDPVEGPYVGRAVWYARKVLAMKAVVDALGDPRFRTVLCWGATSGWAFFLNQWNGYRPVNAECRAAAVAVGHVAIAPYFYAPSAEAVETAIGFVSEWRTQMDPLNVKLHCYEAGQHYFGPTSEQTSQEMLNAWVEYLELLNEKMDTGSSVFLYGLAAIWSSSYGAYGMVERLGDTNAKWTTVRDTILRIQA